MGLARRKRQTPDKQLDPKCGHKGSGDRAARYHRIVITSPLQLLVIVLA